MNCLRIATGWIAVAALLIPAMASAEPLVAVTGVVRDPAGMPLPGVSVVVMGAMLQGQRTTESDSGGNFRISLPPGVYTFEFLAAGFTTTRLDGVEVRPGMASSVEITMEEPRAVEMVVVSAGPPAGGGVRGLGDRCDDPETPEPDSGADYRPICFLGTAAYAFNAPPDLRYLEQEELLFRLDPTTTALEAREDVEGLGLRGTVEAATVPWSRCMEAGLVETTIGPTLRARELTPSVDEPRLRITALHADPVRRIGLHPTDWRWTIEGIRPGRTQLALRLYAVAVRRDSQPGSPECGSRGSGRPDGARRVRTLQRRLAIEVSPAEWVEARLWSPWLWSLLLPPAGLVLAWWRRRGARPVLGPDA